MIKHSLVSANFGLFSLKLDDKLLQLRQTSPSDAGLTALQFMHGPRVAP
jgi:hypothetical protein